MTLATSEAAGSPLDDITAYLSQHVFAGQPVRPDEDLVYSGAIDSLGVMRLVAFLEERFGIAIPPQDITLALVETPTSLADYVQACHGAAA